MIISGWSMSPLDGPASVRLVRTGDDSPNSYVPIMLAGHTGMNRVLKRGDAGVNEFLAKPISARGLYPRIRAIVENPREFINIKDYLGRNAAAAVSSTMARKGAWSDWRVTRRQAGATSSISTTSTRC